MIHFETSQIHKIKAGFGLEIDFDIVTNLEADGYQACITEIIADE